MHKKLNKRKRIILVITLVIANIAVGFVGYRIYQDYVRKYDVRLANGQIESSSLSDLQKKVQKQSDDSMMNIQFNVKPTFIDGGEKGDLFIANSYKNKQDIKVKIYLEDSRQEVLKTEVLKPGTTIPATGLQKKLSNGDYKAVASVQFLKSNGEVESENEVDMLLHVSS